MTMTTSPTRKALFGICVLGIIAGATKAESLGDVFSSKQTKWNGVPGRPEFTATEGKAGFRFPCDFNKVADECCWTAPAKIDLSKAASITVEIYLKNEAPFRAFGMYFRSGDGMYARDYRLFEGKNVLVINKDTMNVIGKALGWDKIDGIRVSVYKLGTEGKSTVTITDVRTSTKRLPETVFQWPERDKDLKHPNKRDRQGRLLESRMILDEGSAYLTQDIDKLLDRIAAAGFNAYMPCVWHGSGAKYESKVAVANAGYAKYKGVADPFGVLIKKAHARGIEVHAWFNVALRQTDKYSEFAEPGTPQGAFDLQNPKFRDFIVKVMTEVAQRYDVDGINLDYIRTIGVSYSPTARQLYFKRYGKNIDELRTPASPDVQKRLGEWQGDAVADVVRRTSQQVRAIKPNAVISVCGSPRPKPAMSMQGRNEWRWVENDWVDVAYDMDYWPVSDIHIMERVRAGSPHPERFAKMMGNYDKAMMRTGPRDPQLVATMMDYFRCKFPGSGIALYFYNLLTDDQIKALRQGPFKENAVPDWPSRSMKSMK